jgi:glycosyltransferase involved in cell wall biosynthesis
MRIAFTSTFDVKDKTAFGGRCFYMAKELGRHFDITWVGPLSYRKHWARLRAKQIIQHRLFHKTFWQSRDRALVRDYSRQISDALHRNDVDVVFSPMSPGSQPIAYLECRQPIVIWTDATFIGWEQSFPSDRAGMSDETIRDAIANETAALNRAALVIYSSEWAARGAIENYDLDPEKVKVVPFGANLEVDYDLSEERVAEMAQARPRDVCRLLFVGTDWERKGGDLAIALATRLNARGIKTELTVLTDHHRFETPLPSFVRVQGYLSKSTLSGLKRWNRLLARSHFVVLPTQSDATPLILSEASAFGVPSLTSDIGGIPSVIRDDVNGRMFPLESGVEGYVKYIEETFADYSRYLALSRSSVHEFQARLSWPVAAAEVAQLVTNLGLKSPVTPIAVA